jgi:putative restriction endonuclease
MKKFLPVQCERWLKVVANLRVDRKGTIAPHKPLLLLVLAELAEQGKLTNKILPLTGELVFRFLVYWTVVAKRRPQRPDIHLPFYHMRSDGCWTPLNSDGQPTLERRRTVAAELDETFLDCLGDSGFRRQMRRILIAKYFVDFAERTALYQLVGVPVPPEAIVSEDARLYEAARERGREARFRLTVVPAYNYTCAFTRYRLATIDSGSIAEAAHVHQFADSRNNHPRNGIAFARTRTGCLTRVFGHWTMSIVCSLIRSASMSPARTNCFCHSRRTPAYSFLLTLITGQTKRISRGIANTIISNLHELGNFECSSCSPA